MIKLKRFQKAHPAQALVEFALIISVLLTFFFIIIEGGRYLWAWNTVQNAAREGGRFAITGQKSSECLVGEGMPGHLPKFDYDDPDFTNPNEFFLHDLCDETDEDIAASGYRVAAITDRAHTILDALPLDESTDNTGTDFFYNIRVDGAFEGAYQADFGGVPNNYVAVTVDYYVPFLTPLRAIIPGAFVSGQVELLNESFGALGSNTQGQGLPPVPPILPTFGVPPTPTPTFTPTPLPTAGPSPTPTETGTTSPTPTPDVCPVRFEGTAVAGNTHVLVTGDVGTTVEIFDVDAGLSLGTVTLIAIPGHSCAGFADFIEPTHTALSAALIEGHLLLAISSNGTNDETFVQGTVPTATPTPSNTPPPTATASPTPSITPTATPSTPYIIAIPNCSNFADTSVTVQGFNWPPNEDISLFWDNFDFQEKILKQNHNGDFSGGTWTIRGLTSPNTYVIRAESQNGTERTVDFVVPCDTFEPTPSTSTPTSTPRPADLVMISPPQLVSARPINAYESVEFSVLITNTGQIDINQQFFVDLYFDPTDVFTNYIPITQSVGFSAVSNLPSGASQAYTITAPLGFENLPDPHIVYGMVDSLNGESGGQIPEPDETNNVSLPAVITNVIQQATPTATPTFDPSGTNFIAGIVHSRDISFLPQERAIVLLLDGDSLVIGTTQSDQNGYYIFNNVPDDSTYTVVSCIAINGHDYYGLHTGIVPPNPTANVYMLPGTCNLGGTVNKFPLVTNPGNQEDLVGASVSLPIVASDPDSGPDPLTYFAVGLPPGLSIDLNSGLINGTLPPASQGFYNTTIYVYDGEDTTSIVFIWKVTTGRHLETITVSNVSSGGWTTANLNNNYTKMVAVCTVTYNNNTEPQIVRMQNATGNSFDIRLQNPNGESLTGEDVHCLVIEEGTWQLPDGRNIEAKRVSSTITDRKNNWNGQGQSYGQSYTTPIVLGQVMTYNDADWSTFWNRGTGQKQPPSSSALFTGKHVGEDNNGQNGTARANEIIGFIVVEQGDGTVDGAHYEARLGSDTVSGVGNNGTNSYTYSFVSSFSGAPTVGVLSQMAMDGGDGGYAVLMGANPFANGSFELAIDEERLNDSERTHTTEQVGYFVFNSHVLLDGTE